MKFYKKLIRDAITISKKHNEWIKVRDDYIKKCSTFNIDWNKVKDAFILQDEIAEEYLWNNFNNDFLKEIKEFINVPSPSLIISIYSNPVKNIENYSKTRKRVWWYKKLKIYESLENINKELEENFNVMVFNNYHNNKCKIEIQIILSIMGGNKHF
jgi:hypothetical protein